MTTNSSRISYAGRRMLALMKGKENIDDFPEPEIVRLWCAGCGFRNTANITNFTDAFKYHNCKNERLLGDSV